MKKLFVIIIALGALQSCTPSQVNQTIATTSKIDSIAKAHQAQIDSLAVHLSKLETKKQ